MLQTPLSAAAPASPGLTRCNCCFVATEGDPLCKICQGYYVAYENAFHNQRFEQARSVYGNQPRMLAKMPEDIWHRPLIKESAAIKAAIFLAVISLAFMVHLLMGSN